MGKIKELLIAKKEQEQIKSIIKEDERYRVRNRANSILYNYNGYKVKDIANLLNVKPQTVYLWIRKFEEDGMSSFYDKEGRGRKSILNPYEEEIKALVNNQSSLRVANAKIQKKLNIYVHNETLRKYLKKNKIQLYTSS